MKDIKKKNNRRIKHSIVVVRKDGWRTMFSLSIPDELAIGVAADCAEQSFYWTDISNGRISRANLQGFDKELVTTGTWNAYIFSLTLKVS